MATSFTITGTQRLKSLLLLWVLIICVTLISCSEEQPAQITKGSAWYESLEGRYIAASKFESRITGVNYPYHIYLPASYENSSSKNYPVIYVLDAQWNFQIYAETVERLGLDVIVVGIEGGPLGSNRREIDYAPPGAVNYLDFLTQEFIPSVEDDYRINSSNRALQGVSLGGVAVTLAFLSSAEVAVFRHYIADDPAYWYASEVLNQALLKRTGLGEPLQGNIYITSAFPLGNFWSVHGFVNDLQSTFGDALELESSMHLTSHRKIIGRSIDETLKSVYSLN